jgi:primosomal protein N' (replication factor Y) (superfamily II helicase)
MHIIHVIPISRGIGKETLSYFTSANIPHGSIVEVPLRNRSIPALVVGSESAESLKSQIKSAPFTFKKIEATKNTQFLTPQFLDTVKQSAEHFSATSGAVLSSILPSVIVENVKKISTVAAREKIPARQEKFIVQADDEERFANYRSHIRQEFARKASVFFTVPTVEDAKRAQKFLEKGIEPYTFVIHSSLPKKKLLETWNRIHTEAHPILIIATGAFLSISRQDIATIIVEKENSRSYKTHARPYLDIRTFAEILSEKTGSKLIMGDILLRTETLWRYHAGELIELTPLKFRSLSTAEQTLVDMRKYVHGGGVGFKILSDEIEALITKNKDNNERLFFLCARRGIAPSTVCGDCQSIVMCNNCSAPVVLHKSKKGDDYSFFLCHRCGERRTTEEYCKICGSWKLGTVGIGIDLIEEKIKDKFPDVKLLRMDADTVKTEKTAQDVIEKFYTSPGSILLGTEMALLYLHEKIENSAIISIDSLFSIPDFRIHEKIFYTMLRLRGLTTKNFVLQTRNAEEKVLEYSLKGNLIDFYRDEIKEREAFGYPPFNTLIKITLEGEKEAIVKEMEGLQNTLEPYQVDVFPAFTQTVRGKHVLHGLMKIAQSNWVDKVLLMKLLSLPQHISIKVDPESLL